MDPVTCLQGRVIAIVNVASGGADAGSATRMAAVFAAAGLADAQTITVDAQGVDQALRDGVDAADILVVLGGDGTLRAAAEECGRAGKPLIPLAGGTMNMLARALYGPIPWERALEDTLAVPSLRPVSGGTVGGQPFFCAAIFGSPSHWADAREALREGDVVKGANLSWRALRRHAMVLDYHLGDGPRSQAEGLAVLCPLISRAMACDEPSLEAVALERVAVGDMFRLAFHAIFDDWRQDPGVNLAQVCTVRLTARGRIPAILDGEKTRLGRAVTVTFRSAAFTAVVPAEG